MPDAPSLAAFARTAHALADIAAEKSLPIFRRRAMAVTNKAGNGFDPVTRADTAAEHAMRQILARDWPHHDIWGEEEGYQSTMADYIWVLDPIDGTRSFITGNPLWGTLIALLQRKQAKYQLLVSLINMPVLGERYMAIGQRRTQYWRDTHTKTRPISLATRKMARLAHAHVLSTSPDMFTASRALSHSWQRLQKTVALTRYGGDCYNYALLAAGHVDAVIDRGNKTHDTQALIGIVKQAGGLVTDWQGRSLLGPNRTEQARGETLACGDARLHKQLIHALKY